MRWAIRVVACVAALLLLIPPVARAEDSERPRFYLGLRGQDSNPVAGVHDAWGLSLGANLGKYWGLEFSADTFERRVHGGDRTLGEYGVLALVPQVRLRYPLLGDRLVPYVVGGAGLGLSNFNDRKAPAFGVSIQDKESSFLVGTVGAGLEYFIADNIAAGLEVKYVLAGDQTLRIDGVRHDQEVQSPLITVGLRMFLPELRPPAAGPGEAPPLRLYLGFRFGAAITTDRSGFETLRVEPEPPAYFSEGNQVFGAMLGLDFGRHWGLELVAEAYEVRLADATLGSLEEAAVTTIIPHVRWRYPLLGGRLVPFVVGGVGLGYLEINDAKPPSQFRDLTGTSFGVAAAAGAGAEYFVASNISVGLDARYHTSRGHTFRIDGRQRDAAAEAVIVTFAIRVYLWDGRRD